MEHIQEPVAVVGFSCRLPGGNNTPDKLWEFLEQGEIASRDVPKNRFTFESHYDGSLKPGTMRPPGGMFLEKMDPSDFDASFFEISGADAISMDPNQRQMLEVVFEGLENGGITMDSLNGKSVACFVASFATDYGDLQNRDPLDRASNHVIGIGRASLANRLSYFLNIRGPSVTIDTACSGSMVALHLAVRALHNRESDSAIVATSNIFLNPEHTQEVGSLGQAHSPSGLCHTFDSTADGYIKSEAVSSIIVKRLSDAIRDRDPIRAVIRGTASTSNGRTNGLASPSSEAQAAAIRQAYASAGITNFNDTAYLEAHGTGTPAGDPAEVNGAGSVFAAGREADKPLIIGSIKANLGHAEPSAGSNGVIKAILSLEKGIIPGTPSFINPSPKIDFITNKVRASRQALLWPDEPGKIRRASVNSFGYGGSNAHAIIEQAASDQRATYVASYLNEDDLTYEDDQDVDNDIVRPYTLVVSANDAAALKGNIEALCKHLINPRVRVNLDDLSYTLSERRSNFFHRAYVVTQNTDFEPSDFVLSKRYPKTPRIGFVFTGQGAQWPQMGKDLLQYFPETRKILEEFDEVLQSLPSPPSWSFVKELSEPRTLEHLRQPEFSQPLVTALQLAILSILEGWGVTSSSVVGHSSGEIAAAYAAGFLNRADAIKAAFYRGRAAVNRKEEAEADVGMLAVGLSAEAVAPFIEKFPGDVWIACFNSPSSLTISGRKKALEALASDIKSEGHFARLLLVDLAYHSELMRVISEEYENLLDIDSHFSSTEKSSPDVAMFSSVTGSKKTSAADALYWKSNMVSPVRFAEALTAMVSDSEKPDILIEIGPSGALAGPISQVLKSLPSASNIAYFASWARGTDAAKSLFKIGGSLFNAGAPVNLAAVNQYKRQAKVIVDLPNYTWNHSIKYWFENAASLDWRFKPYLTHDLIGSKVLSSPWQSPSWRKRLSLADVPWLKDHAMGSDIIMPAAGYVTMALEAMYQKHCALNADSGVKSPGQLSYRFRNIRFERALVVEEGKPIPIILSLPPIPGNADWHEFRVLSEVEGVITQHCHGLVRVQDAVEESITGADLAPLKNPSSSKLWYKAQNEIGMGFGPAFQKIESIESTSGQQTCRARVSLEPPKSKWDPQSYYPIHPAVLDACFQSVNPALVAGERSKIQDIMIPSVLDDVVINSIPTVPDEGLALAESVFTERGRKDQLKSYFANVSMYDPESGALFVRVRGLHITKLDVGPRPDPHTFHRVSWKPDVSFLTQDQVIHLDRDSDIKANKVDSIVDLVAHKKPTLKVLEVNLDRDDASSLWFQAADFSARSAYAKYEFASTDAKSLVGVQSQHASRRSAAFSLANPAQEALGLAADGAFDLAIIKAPKKTEVTVEDIVRHLQPLLASDAFTLLLQSGGNVAAPPTKDSWNHIVVSNEDFPTSSSASDAPSTPTSEHSETAPSSVASFVDLKASAALGDLSHVWTRRTLRRLEKAGLFDSIVEVDSPADGGVLAYLGQNLTASGDGREARSELVVFRFDESTPRLAACLQDALESKGWKVTHRATKLPQSDLAAQPVVLVLDELTKPLLTRIDEEQWDTLKALVSSGSHVLWVTKGAQHDRVTDPDRALVHGLFRVARREDPTAKLTVLDVQSATSLATVSAIEQVLEAVRRGDVADTEYAERDGVIYTHRVLPDAAVNAFKRAEVEGNEPVVKGFHETDVQVHIHGERVGTLDLAWCEEELVQPELQHGIVEVEVKTVGVNFKDVATTMGIVPENEFTIGCECAGIVRRLGPGVTKFKIGDRVAVMSKGTYANRVRVEVGRAHAIPSWLSYEDAATMPLVYMTALYSLFNLANLKEGQSVLIHSAAGGVGLAAIQLSQYKKAEIFVTVGTDEKRDFLANTFGIPSDHIFSSRDTKFAEQIKQATNGRGVDVILNSLIGELLDASWRICADGGTMVEIGKRDIVDRNSLSMEPFDRNCSFRAIDLSYTKHFTSEVSAGLLNEIFTLVEGRHIGPIHPITTYGFDAVPAALAYIRRGQHIGKIVITNRDQPDVQLPIRPALRRLQLQPNVSYLIVGGLKGLCGSLAIHMAHHGARHIIACSRSGLSDEASARIVNNCKALGCEVVDARGDVSDNDFVRRVFKLASPSIGGVIQGAMVLRDKPYEIMTHEDYHTAIEAKVKGTWNLHRASQDIEVQKQPLDFFTMLSSVSGVIGNKGQANYAAGNTFLDAFANYRLSLGLAANTVDLGAIQDVGYVAETGSSLESRFDTRQWTPINEAALRKILSYSILQQDRQNHLSSPQLITGITYPMHASSSDVAGDPRFGYLFSGGDEGEAGDDASGGKDEADQAAREFRLMVSHLTVGADASSLVNPAVALLSAQVTKVLRLEAEVETGKPLVAYGLDSLSAVEIRGWARTKLGAELSTLDITNAASIFSLGEKMVAKLVPQPAA